MNLQVGPLNGQRGSGASNIRTPGRICEVDPLIARSYTTKGYFIIGTSKKVSTLACSLNFSFPIKGSCSQTLEDLEIRTPNLRTDTTLLNGTF